jgi:hypothetical protein
MSKANNDYKVNHDHKVNPKTSHKKKWLTLALIGGALLLIPRRSSRQDAS